LQPVCAAPRPVHGAVPEHLELTLLACRHAIRAVGARQEQIDVLARSENRFFRGGHRQPVDRSAGDAYGDDATRWMQAARYRADPNIDRALDLAARCIRGLDALDATADDGLAGRAEIFERDADAKRLRAGK
jgi:hypothetical protein